MSDSTPCVRQGPQRGTRLVRTAAVPPSLGDDELPAAPRPGRAATGAIRRVRHVACTTRDAGAISASCAKCASDDGLLLGRHAGRYHPAWHRASGTASSRGTRAECTGNDGFLLGRHAGGYHLIDGTSAAARAASAASGGRCAQWCRSYSRSCSLLEVPRGEHVFFHDDHRERHHYDLRVLRRQAAIGPLSTKP